MPRSTTVNRRKLAQKPTKEKTLRKTEDIVDLFYRPLSPKGRTRLRFAPSSKRSLVEAAGIEPASENLSAEHLHT